MAKRIPLRREAAAATIAGYMRFAAQAAGTIYRLQARRRKLRAQLRTVDRDLKAAKRLLRDVTNAQDPPRHDDLDTPMPVPPDSEKRRS